MSGRRRMKILITNGLAKEGISKKRFSEEALYIKKFRVLINSNYSFHEPPLGGGSRELLSLTPYTTVYTESIIVALFLTLL